MKMPSYKYRIIDILKQYPNGLPLSAIGAKMNIWHTALAKDIDELEKRGRIEGIFIKEKRHYIWRIKEKKIWKWG